MKVSFELDGKIWSVNTTEVEVMRLVASTKGVRDVDIEPFPDRIKIKATGVEASTGKTMAEACRQFLRQMLT